MRNNYNTWILHINTIIKIKTFIQFIKLILILDFPLLFFFYYSSPHWFFSQGKNGFLKQRNCELSIDYRIDFRVNSAISRGLDALSWVVRFSSLGLYLSKSIMFLLKTVVVVLLRDVVLIETMGCCWMDDDGEMESEELDEHDEEFETEERTWDWDCIGLKSNGDWALVEATEHENLLSS